MVIRVVSIGTVNTEDVDISCGCRSEGWNFPMQHLKNRSPSQPNCHSLANGLPVLASCCCTTLSGPLALTFAIQVPTAFRRVAPKCAAPCAMAARQPALFHGLHLSANLRGFSPQALELFVQRRLALEDLHAPARDEWIVKLVSQRTGMAQSLLRSTSSVRLCIPVHH